MTEPPVFSIQSLDFYYSASKALSNINLDILPRKVTALIGPSGCGKSTFLRCLNRMNDTIAGTRVDGKILLNGKNIYDEDMDVVTLRQKVGMVFGEYISGEVAVRIWIHPDYRKRGYGTAALRKARSEMAWVFPAVPLVVRAPAAEPR